MKRNKKRSSILKRPSMSNSENSSPATDTGTTANIITRQSKRISFSGKSKVKEFADGDDCITIWNNSYEKSADHFSTAVSSNEVTTGPNNSTKPELPIMSGPNKENIVVNNESSTNISMSTTVQLETTEMAMHHFNYKSPGKIIHKTSKEDKSVENDSMELEDLDTYKSVSTSSRKTILDGEMSFLVSSDPILESKPETENENSQDSEMSMELFCGELKAVEKNRKTIVFDKESLEISKVEEKPKKSRATTFDFPIEEIADTKNTKRCNRRQTQLQLNDMEVTTLNLTSTVPAKKDRRATILESDAIDITLKHNEDIVCDESMTLEVSPVDIRLDRKTIVFDKDELDLCRTVLTEKTERATTFDVNINVSTAGNNTKKRNRKQSKIELQDMELSSINVTPVVPAKRDKRETVFESNAIDITLEQAKDTVMDQSMMIDNVAQFMTKTHKEQRKTVIQHEEINETLAVVKTSETKPMKIHAPTRKTIIFHDEKMMEDNSSVAEKQNKKEENFIFDNNSIDCEAVDKIGQQRMSLVHESTTKPVKERRESQLSKIPRNSVYVVQDVNETLLEKQKQSNNNNEKISQVSNQPSKNIFERNRRQTTVDTLSMEVSTLNISTASKTPTKRERRETILFKEESVECSDIDLTLQNLSQGQCADRASSDMDITRVPNGQKHIKTTPSKIPRPTTRLRLESKLSHSEKKETSIDAEKSYRMLRDTGRKTIYDQSMQIEYKQISHQVMEETPVTEIEKPSTLIETSPDCLRRQTLLEIANLSTKRFKDLNKTMEHNELLDKESDLSLLIDSTLTDPVKNTNESVYPQCSYANITIENFSTPDIFATKKSIEQVDQIPEASCVCNETTLHDNSLSMTTMEGISPNISVRLSLANELVEQIRQRVLRQTPIYCKNCKCLSESRLTKSTTDQENSLIDWSRFAHIEIPSVQKMEREFIKEWEKMETQVTDLKQKSEVPSVSFLLENLRENIIERANKIDNTLFSLERCPAPYPATKPFVYLIKNKLESEAIPWTVVRSIHAPIGIIQLRNSKLKSILLHVRIEPRSLKEKNTLIYQSVKFIKNLIHPLSSPFTFCLFETFVKQFPLDSSFLHMCKDSNYLFEFLGKIDEAISEMHTNVGQLFSILKEHKTTVYLENSILKAKLSVIDEGVQVIRVYLNLADPANFHPNDINSEPEVENLRERSNGFNLKGVELLEYFLSNVNTIVLNK